MTPSRSVPILTYHSIDDSRSVISISPATFKMQMKYLAECGYQSLSFSEAVVFLREKKPFPEKAFVATFDDGYENNYTGAFPVLQQFGFKGTIFLISDYCGKTWSGDASSLEPRSLLSWAEIKEMHRHGIEFGAHTLTHPDLTLIPVAQAERETRQSKAEIQERLGAEVTTFAYPYGKYSSEVKKIVQTHFHGACSTVLGKAVAGSDLFLLKRIDMYYLKHPGLFKRLPTNTLAGYLKLRQMLRGLKHFVGR